MSPSRRTADVPVVSDDFVGREPELDRLSVLLLGAARLITVVGPGGIGKTRLAMEAAHRLRRARRTGVHWVRLARLAPGADAASVEDEVARSVIESDFSGRSSWQALVDVLDRRDAVGRALQTVVVMDNCEHVPAGAGAVISELLDTVPGLTVLATSRRPVGWVDEQLVQLPPLTRHQAVALFRQRAELSGQVVDDSQVAVVENICAHLNRHPLPIRLAAARVRRQPLSLILDDLTGDESDRRMHWSAGPRLGADARHQGIVDVIGWSIELCSPKERLLFERMSVFAAGYDVNPDDHDDGGFGVELSAVREICAGADRTGAELEADEIEGLLERLADQSLVSVRITPDAVRYSLLESFRVFAQRRLRARDAEEPARLAARHRRYYRDMVVAAATGWFSSRERTWLEWARAAWGNLLLAVDSSLITPSEAEIGLVIAVGTTSLRLPFFKGSLREARRWVARTLEVTRKGESPPAELQVTAMAASAWISLCQGLPRDAAEMLEQCVAECTSDPAVLAAWRDDPVSYAGLPAAVDFASGASLMLVDQDVRALVVLARAREKFTAMHDFGAAAMSELFEALSAAFHGNAEQALSITRRNLETATASGAEWNESWAELAQAIAETKYGDPRQALETTRTALARQVAMRDSWGAVWAVHIRAWNSAHQLTTAEAAAENRVEQATELARLLGGAAALRVRLGVEITQMGPLDAETARATEVSRSILGTAAYERAWQQGNGLRPVAQQVSKLALGTLPFDRPVAPAVADDLSPAWLQLSGAEQDVALLAAAGWTNTAIATRRGSSRRTVDAQVAAVLRKLDITSRDDILPLAPTSQQDRIDRERDRHPNTPRGAGS